MDRGLGMVLLPYLLLGAAAAADGGGDGDDDIQINQMDLLSGVPALLVILVGVVQVWPSPAQMCRPGLYEFLNWLKVSVENDFYISVFSCDKKCQTQLFEPTIDSINKRICINVGDAREIGCIGSGDVSVDELIDIIQADGNGVTLTELAMTARYPRMKQLNRIITVLRFSPTFGRRVIIFQWLAVGIMYMLSWLFRGWLFSGIKRLLRGLWNVVRRVFGLLPVDYVQYRRFGLDYHMAELAEHRLVFEHLPWVRYSVYYLLLKLAGRQLSIRAWGIEDKKSIYKRNYDTAGGKKGNEDCPAFEHPMVDQRRLAALIATDECSAALLLFAISLHSLRVMMLCRGIGFLPAHVVTGSYSKVCLELEHTIIVFRHLRLEAVYKALYMYQGYNKNNTEIGPEIRDYLHLSYSLLLKKLQSPLGDQITSQQQLYILINLALRDVDTAYVDWIRDKIPRNPDIPQPNIEGIIISDEQLSKLYRGHMNALLSIHTLLESFLVSNIYWGVSVWLLRTLLVVCNDFQLIEPDSSVTGKDQSAGRSGRTSEIVEMLYLLVNSPFPMHIYSQVREDNAADTWVEPKVPKNPSRGFRPRFGRNKTVTKSGELLWMIKDNLAFNDDDECTSAPAWCVCRGHCRGICTLIVNELDMYLSIRNYLSTPYSFMMDTVKEKPGSEDQSDGDEEVQDTPKLMLRTDKKDKTDTATSEPSTPVIAAAKIFRLVCICNRHLLLRLVKDGRVTRRGKSYRLIDASDDEQDITKPSKGVSLVAKWWQSINVRHRFEQSTPRIDYTYYPLSNCLYENTAQLVIILGDQLYTARPPTNASADASYSKQLWPFNKFEEEFRDRLEQNPHEVIRRALPLRLPSVDMFAQQITKEVAMSEGRLQRGRRRRRKDRYELAPPSGNIRVKLDVAKPK
ncbi:hypothetical protein LPJ53_001824 [Coemansia erecta]|uniref:Uncharacterized protein n=1 Tax=Coemansia erecta TaxID=147472 RepID=A0A9W8CUH2_9FUNG|nr:hypothetical protein LPJ53_001824 [Coemansia erecta]